MLRPGRRRIGFGGSDERCQWRWGGTIALAEECTYRLSQPDNFTDGSDTGLPLVTADIVIRAQGATIARSAAAGTPDFRIFDVESAAT